LKTIILSDEVEGRKEFHKRFFLEAKAAGKLTHPNIITVYDFGEEGDLAYMAMELLKGIELRARCCRARSRSSKRSISPSRVADGLAYAHERGVVHRDIKPSNIMLLPRGQVKIMDFGIAAAVRVADHKTSTGVVLGTPRYMSRAGGGRCARRTAARHLFARDRALRDAHPRRVVRRRGHAADPAQRRPRRARAALPRWIGSVPSMLDFVIARALQKDPAVRYQDAYELAADLRACLTRSSAAGRAHGGQGRRRRSGRHQDREARCRHGEDAARAPRRRAIGSDTRLPLSEAVRLFHGAQAAFRSD